MKNEEIQRIQQYSVRLSLADGDLNTLTPEERKDLCALLQKREQEQIQACGAVPKARMPDVKLPGKPGA